MSTNMHGALKILSLTAAGSAVSAISIALVWDYSSYLQDGQSIFDSSNRVALGAVIGFCIGLFVGVFAGFLIALFSKNVATSLLIGCSVHLLAIMLILTIAGGGNLHTFPIFIGVLGFALVGLINGALLNVLVNYLFVSNKNSFP